MKRRKGSTDGIRTAARFYASEKMDNPRRGYGDQVGRTPKQIAESDWAVERAREIMRKRYGKNFERKWREEK